MSTRKININGNFSNLNPLYHPPPSSSSLTLTSYDQISQTIPVMPSNHPLVCSITLEHIQKIQLLYSCSAATPDSMITSCTDTMNPHVSLRSFYNLLSFGCPIDDSIFYSFLKFLPVTRLDCHAVDTSFHRFFMRHGWDKAFTKFFLHNQSSNFSKKTNLNHLWIPVPFWFWYMFMVAIGLLLFREQFPTK